jgi:uncharacterized LabA/DUF88 family protein
VVVFLDWQNVYKGARESFHEKTHAPICGQVKPVALAERIAEIIPDGDLKQVRIYRGIPSNERDPKGYGAARRQMSAWDAAASEKSRLHVYMRTLQYLDGYEPREKGIDVQLAIDYVTLGVAGDYDVGVIFSTDTDLKPALDAVYDFNGPKRPWPWVAAWSGPNHAPRCISASGKRKVPCAWLDESSYNKIRDYTRYEREPKK